jgi:ubiquinone/menaquinone biosynthesis C-methylase UbiE
MPNPAGTKMDLAAAVSRICANTKTLIWKGWYEFLAESYRGNDWRFMNYGYAPVGGEADSLRLEEADQDNRLSIGLYHHVAGGIELENLDVLEVGSGRGGGADYVRRYLRPKKIVGIDFSTKTAVASNRNYVAEGLFFCAGNAEALPFADCTFDAVINIESSHCYGSMDVFLGEVRRVLREGGYFLCADFRPSEKMDALRSQVRRSGLSVVREADITKNVTEALTLGNERRTARIKATFRRPLIRRIFLQFAGTKGSRIYEMFKSRKYIYLSFVIQKPPVETPSPSV